MFTLLCCVSCLVGEKNEETGTEMKKVFCFLNSCLFGSCGSVSFLVN